MMNAISIALSGLGASMKQLGAAASNIANMGSSGSLEPGGKAPYEAKTTVQSSTAEGGVEAEVVSKKEPFIPAYDPNSPYANDQGLVAAPNVDLAEEAVQMKLAELTYKANIRTIQAASDMAKEAGRILDEKA